jgi:hypothetical protein
MVTFNNLKFAVIGFIPDALIVVVVYVVGVVAFVIGGGDNFLFVVNVIETNNSSLFLPNLLQLISKF